MLGIRARMGAGGYGFRLHQRTGNTLIGLGEFGIKVHVQKYLVWLLKLKSEPEKS